jgi:ABC-type multidrug transport system ATPase subunit
MFVNGMPSLLFVGLDSHAALVVMEHLRGLCAEGRTVICSIHQPRQAIWDMFDVVEVLSEGRLMYFGPKALVILIRCLVLLW